MKSCPCSSRTPHGVRGLKYAAFDGGGRLERSHPSRGAWIEITSKTSKEPHMIGRTPHGVRGLKSVHRSAATAGQQVAPLTGCVD